MNRIYNYIGQSEHQNRADDPVRTLSDQVGERIAAGLAGRKGGEVVALKRRVY
jgi:hypothetical protein